MKRLSKLDRLRGELGTAESRLKAHPYSQRCFDDVTRMTRRLREAETEALKKHLESHNAGGPLP